jgi:hypothetical protein
MELQKMHCVIHPSPFVIEPTSTAEWVNKDVRLAVGFNSGSFFVLALYPQTIVAIQAVGNHSTIGFGVESVCMIEGRVLARALFSLTLTSNI